MSKMERDLIDRSSGCAEQNNNKDHHSEGNHGCHDDDGDSTNSFMDSLFLSENNLFDTHDVSLLSSPSPYIYWPHEQQLQPQQPTTLQERLQQQQQQQQQALMRQIQLQTQRNDITVASFQQSHHHQPEEYHTALHQMTFRPTLLSVDPHDGLSLVTRQQNQPRSTVSTMTSLPLDDQRLVASYKTETTTSLPCHEKVEEEESSTSTANHDMLFNPAGTTPLTRLFAMADQKDPVTALATVPTNAKKRAMMIPHLPLTSMSPSLVIATMGLLPVSNKKQAREGPKHPHSSYYGTPAATIRLEPPQCVLERLLRSNGLPVGHRVTALEAKYDTVPSPLQLASYGTAVMKAVHTDNVVLLDELLKAGLSPNPCNQFRDSILDYVCQNAKAAIFHCLVQNHAELRVCDAFGRTPLSYCAWSNVFCESIVKTILDTDPQQLFLEDKQGQTPVEVINPSAAPDWIDFLSRHKDVYLHTLPTVQTLEHRVQLRDPPNALSIPVAQAVSSGRLVPKDVAVTTAVR